MEKRGGENDKGDKMREEDKRKKPKAATSNIFGAIRYVIKL